MLKKIRLELARTPDHPSGSQDHGYVIIAPLGDDSKLDAALWAKEAEACRVTRFWGTDPHRHGLLELGQSAGSRAPHWFIRFDSGDNPETPEIEWPEQEGFNLGQEQFVPGEYISLTDDPDDDTTFLVVAVEPADRPSLHKTHL